MKIVTDDLSGEAIAKLLAEHGQDMLSHSPEESAHFLDLDALKAPDVTFYSAWVDGELAGCGALKDLGDNHGEIKSMRTKQTHLRQGVAGAILTHILEQAKSRDYTQLSLETGSMAAFMPAQKLYQRFGFDYCEPFGAYAKDLHSVFMTKQLLP